jgi:hypothetical protein
METLNTLFKDFDYNSKNSKIAASFIIPFVLFFILTPGVFFSINKDEEKKICTERKTNFSTALIHSFIFSIISCFIYYIYFSKLPSGVYKSSI